MSLETPPENSPKFYSKRLAAIDLGSNSFHMVIADLEAEGGLNILHRQKQKIQLRSGIEDNGTLSLEAQERALACFVEFSKSLKEFEVQSVEIVGTYTLRAALGLENFLKQAEEILGYPIRIISGEEEARLIYVGASQRRDLSARHLIIDIGGGSTELIIGEVLNKAPKILTLASLSMGSVSFQEMFFKQDVLSQENFSQAILAGRKLVQSVSAKFLSLGWRFCLGSSGTIQAVLSVIQSLMPGETEITLPCLESIMNRMIKMGSVSQIDFSELREDRQNIFAGGLSVLLSLFYELRISSMGLSKGALREGVLFEMSRKLIL